MEPAPSAKSEAVSAGVKRRRASGHPVGRPSSVEPADRERVVALRSMGWTIRRIAALVDVTDGVIKRVLQAQPVLVQSEAPSVETFDPTLPFEDDPIAQRFVEEHPDGATLDEVGQVFGVCRERIRQIEEVAMRKLRESNG